MKEREAERGRETEGGSETQRDELPQFRAARSAASDALVSAARSLQPYAALHGTAHRASSRALRLIAFQVSPASSIKHDV